MTTRSFISLHLLDLIGHLSAFPASQRALQPCELLSEVEKPLLGLLTSELPRDVTHQAARATKERRSHHILSLRSSKETLKQLHQLFASAVEPKPSSSSSASVFPSLSLPPAISTLIDTQLASFAASFPESTSGSALSERERERTRWRDGLLEIWSIVEPVPGTEGDPAVIARVSAFLVLLEKVSADVKDDDDSALVTRTDIGKVWWDALLKRTILGTPKESAESEKDRARGRRPAKRGKETAQASGDTVRPLTVSRYALAAATKIIVWGMCPTIAEIEQDQNYVPPFCSVVRAEYESRSVAALRGGDEWYGLRNVAECFMAWAEKQPQVRPLV